MSEILWLISILFTFNSISCYPLDLNGNFGKDEKRYPNGTIVGQYSYKDKDGNPINVKYYADDASYGVELNSFKVMTSTSENSLLETLKQPDGNSLPSSFEPASDFQNPSNKHKSEPFETLTKDTEITPFKHDYKSNPDYEILVQNELENPKKCGKDKVRVYLDKEKRKIREAILNLDDAAMFCSQF